MRRRETTVLGQRLIEAARWMLESGGVGAFVTSRPDGARVTIGPIKTREEYKAALADAERARAAQ